MLRALLWTLLTFLLTGLIGRAAVRANGHKMAREIVVTLMDLGLDARLVALESAPRSARQELLDGFPQRMSHRMTLLDKDALSPEEFTSSVVAERPVWTKPGVLLIELKGDQVLQIEALEGSFSPENDPAHVLLPAAVVLSTLSSIAIVFPVARRLQVLTRASSAVASGDLRVRVNDHGKDTIGELARQFDRMTAAIEAQKREREAFFHSVAHELGTPLSRMGLILEMMELATTDEARHKRRAQLQAEVDDLEGLTSELLDWVAQESDRPLELEPVVVSDVLQQLRAREPVQRVAVDVQAAASTVVQADPVGFHRAVDNVLRNARKYARSNVVVRVTETDDWVNIIVEDDGPGVAPADRARIFEPFARVDSSRDRSTGGTGLGLAIVARILARHGGQARVTRSAELGGAAFVLTWPRH